MQHANPHSEKIARIRRVGQASALLLTDSAWRMSPIFTSPAWYVLPFFVYLHRVVPISSAGNAAHSGGGARLSRPDPGSFSWAARPRARGLRRSSPKELSRSWSMLSIELSALTSRARSACPRAMVSSAAAAMAAKMGVQLSPLHALSATTLRITDQVYRPPDRRLGKAACTSHVAKAVHPSRSPWDDSRALPIILEFAQQQRAG